jgi:hypothetical protein
MRGKAPGQKFTTPKPTLPSFEWLNEALVIRHAHQGSRVLNHQAPFGWTPAVWRRARRLVSAETQSQLIRGSVFFVPVFKIAIWTRVMPESISAITVMPTSMATSWDTTPRKKPGHGATTPRQKRRNLSLLARGRAVLSLRRCQSSEGGHSIDFFSRSQSPSIFALRMGLQELSARDRRETFVAR